MKETVETLINELFVLAQDKNEQTIQQYAQEQNITITWHDTVPTCTKPNNVSLSNIVDFGQVQRKILTLTGNMRNW